MVKSSFFKKVIVAVVVTFLLISNVEADQLATIGGDSSSGTFQGLENEKISFKTADLGIVEIDWKSVHSLKSDSPWFVVKEDKSFIEGLIELLPTGEFIVIDTLENRVELEKEAVIAILSITEKGRRYHEKGVYPFPFWEGNLELGGQLSRGNTESADLNFAFVADRISDRRKFSSKFFAEYSVNDPHREKEEVTKNMAGADLQYNIKINGKLYLFFPAGVKHDELVNLSLRTYGGSGFGYSFIRSEKTRLSSELGAIYSYDRISQAPDEKDVKLWVNGAYRQTISDGITVNLESRYTPAVRDFQDYEVHSEAWITTSLYKNIAMRFSIIHDYDNQPPETDPDEPEIKRNDLVTRLSLLYNF